jgi:hypothetical protein
MVILTGRKKNKKNITSKVVIYLTFFMTVRKEKKKS